MTQNSTIIGSDRKGDGCSQRMELGKTLSLFEKSSIDFLVSGLKIKQPDI